MQEPLQALICLSIDKTQVFSQRSGPFVRWQMADDLDDFCQARLGERRFRSHRTQYCSFDQIGEGFTRFCLQNPAGHECAGFPFGQGLGLEVGFEVFPLLVKIGLAYKIGHESTQRGPDEYGRRDVRIGHGGLCDTGVFHGAGTIAGAQQ